LLKYFTSTLLQVEFAGGPFCWVTRTFSATAGGGAFCEGQRIHVSDTGSVSISELLQIIGRKEFALKRLPNVQCIEVAVPRQPDKARNKHRKKWA
jgi:hypothetical protein